jgi:ParB-like chromosome segregation protein Spo0J
MRWVQESPLPLHVDEIGEHYGRYRLHLPEAERAMARSLERYGQLSPVVVCQRQDRYELIDGFKRLGAARTVAPMSHLSARLMEADERTAKAAIYGLNRAGGRTRELEEAWIIQALVREDGLSQVEVAELLGRHKSWVCRRLALIERLGAEAREELRVGLLSPTAARQIVRLPEGNQVEVLQVIRREALSGAELTGVVDLLLQSAGREQQAYVLTQPREALSQAKGSCPPYAIPGSAKPAIKSESGWESCWTCWVAWKCGWPTVVARDSLPRIERCYHPVFKGWRVRPGPSPH